MPATAYVSPARYRLEVCAWSRCRPLASMANEVGLGAAAWAAEMAAVLQDLAALLRSRGEAGYLVVRHEPTGALVVIRQTGP